ncbi:Ig-like domain-containing protein [Pyxidicoccus sp. MSG2]|uniref:Ig-like domain-containing protein n=1 Tax=Pyxidicoccus sp. MSG2 TaxID=2996790 RepID=UPI00226D7BED|nr:Ig-like domain-containing protein [Pyxidicoccus sp. MSG2]MCY1023946.1 hypothetical protein [Pyxidicoccus sp. MSG2]
MHPRLTTAFRPARARLLSLCLAFVSACGGGNPVQPIGTSAGEVAGVVIKGPVQDASVTVYRLDAKFVRGTALGTARTDESGAFTVPVGSYNGALLVVSSSGTYVDEALGTPVSLGGREMVAVIPSYRSGEHLIGVRVTPISTLTAAFAAHHVAAGEELAQAVGEAYSHLNAHFGDVDWRTATPVDLTVAGATTLTPQVRAGLVLAALSQQAATIAQESGVSAALVNGATLTSALAADGADGRLDGAGPAGQLRQASYALDGLTARSGLAAAIGVFVSGPRNASALRLEDVRSLINAMAGSVDEYLFAGGPAAEVDVDAPEVTWLKPAADTGVSGSAPVEVRAVDASGIKSLRFTAPASLVALTSVIDGTSALLKGTLDVSALPDGPLTLTVAAEDAKGNTVSRSVAVTVSNRGPSVSVSAPSDGATLSGRVLLSASATSQQGVVSRLELRNAPSGVGPDTLAAADSYAAQWDTTQAPEGEQVLVFHAEDSFGASTDVSVVVKVDNVALGTVKVSVSAGNPIAGATVRVVALDVTTGGPASRPGGSVLGEGGPTEADGTLTFSLSQENWDGPVQLQVSGSSTLSYVDPTDGTAPVSIPAAVTLTSSLRHYKTGETLVAPVTLYTTLADSAARAYSRGKNSSFPASSYVDALSVVDVLFEKHVAGATPWALRRIVPASLTQPPSQALRDVVFAALPDVSLNQLARSIALSAGLSPVQGFDAVKLLTLLQRDISDGRFDGREGGLLLRVLGTPAYELSADELRVRLAVALDRFVTGPHNRSGLARADFRSAEPNVYDTISLDTSSLFDSAVPPTPFDTNAPVVSWRITFMGDNGTAYTAPVGDTKVVANTLTVEATAVDPEASGVRALTVTADGNALNGQQTASGRVSGMWTPTADGTSELVAVAEDTLGNTTTSRYVLIVDNAAPALAVSAPAAAAFYGAGAVPVDSTATDTNGVASHSVAGLTGASVSGITHVVGSWTPAAGTADGSVTATFAACDVVGNCRSKPQTFALDREAPVLSFATAPVQNTNANTVTFAVRAVDSAAGVAGVYGRRVGSSTPIAATKDAQGTWSLTLPATGEGDIEYHVWAVDTATPANSGESRSHPYKLTPTVRRDTVPPTVELVEGGFYRPEAGIRHKETAPGVPAVPVQYEVSSPSVALTAGSLVFKAVTRIAPGPLDGTDLSSSNTTNTPWLKYSVVRAATESEIVGVDYAITCAGCGAPSSSSGSLLLVDPAGSRVTYALPLTVDTIPGLRNATQTPVTLTIHVTARDAAGNSATSAAASVTFHLISPMLSVLKEDAYPSARDPKSPYGYRVGLFTYDDLWAPGTLAFEGKAHMRLARFRVRNPHSIPMVVNLTSTGAGTWTLKENYTHRKVDDSSTTATAVDGFSFPALQHWDLFGAYDTCAGGQPRPQFPCEVEDGVVLSNPIHPLGSSQQWSCVVPSYTSPSTVAEARSDVESAGYLSPTPTGNEPESSLAPGGYSLNERAAWRVPAASGAVPGELVLYALVPRNRGTMPQFTVEGGTRYQYLYALDYTVETGGQSCTDPNDNRQRLSSRRRALLYRDMTSASLSLALPYVINAMATYDAGAGNFPAVGAPRFVASGGITGEVDLTNN